MTRDSKPPAKVDCDYCTASHLCYLYSCADRNPSTCQAGTQSQICVNCHLLHQMHQTVSSSRGLGSSRASVLECRRQGCCAGPTATHQPARHLATAHAPRWGQLSRACAQAVSQQPAAAAAADSHSQASTSGRQPDFTHEQQQASRRGVLLTVGALVSSLAAPGQLHPAQAAGAEGGSCQLQQSATGLQWCDLTVGEGQKPIKSAFTK